MQQTKILGFSGEQAVADYLIKNNFTILAQNFQTKLGEIDLVAQRDELVVFVEVKTRRNIYFPISTVVTYPKQKKIINTAKLFILQRQVRDKVLRFDVATVTMVDDQPCIDYIENAFWGR